MHVQADAHMRAYMLERELAHTQMDTLVLRCQRICSDTMQNACWQLQAEIYSGGRMWARVHEDTTGFTGSDGFVSEYRCC